MDSNQNTQIDADSPESTASTRQPNLIKRAFRNRFGHWRAGWRGRQAARWTLAGMALLLLAFFGSKFVLEVLLRRP